MAIALRRGVLVPLVATLVVLTAEPAPTPGRAVSAVGAVSFGLVWMLCASLAAVDELKHANGATGTPTPPFRSLLLPVVGPMVAVSDARNQQAAPLSVLFALSVLQLAALTTTLVGLFLPAADADEATQLRLSPVSAGGPGLSLDLTW